jgi:hypothetical protein
MSDQLGYMKQLMLSAVAITCLFALGGCKSWFPEPSTAGVGVARPSAWELRARPETLLG